jgi:hypothetical protein
LQPVLEEERRRSDAAAEEHRRARERSDDAEREVKRDLVRRFVAASTEPGFPAPQTYAVFDRADGATTHGWLLNHVESIQYLEGGSTDDGDTYVIDENGDFYTLWFRSTAIPNGLFRKPTYVPTLCRRLWDPLPDGVDRSLLEKMIEGRAAGS